MKNYFFNHRTISYSFFLALMVWFIFLTPVVQGQENSTISWPKDQTDPPSTSKPSKPGKPKKRSVRTERDSLQLEWTILKKNTNQEPQEINPFQTFEPGNQIKIKIKTNRNGYLYIISYTEKPEGGYYESPRMIYPTPGCMNGLNFIKANEFTFLPLACTNQDWISIVPPTANEVYLVLFSLDLIPDLANSGVSGSSGAGLDPAILTRIKTKADSIPIDRSGLKQGQYTVCVKPTQAKSNQIVETILIRHN